MNKFIAGLLVGFLIIPVGVFSYFRSGRAPVATSAPMMPFEKKLARTALHARLKKEVFAAAPIPADEPNLTAGAEIYREHCAFCHGLPGRPATATAQGMFPKPPQLFLGDGVTDDPVGETYWKVTNGIRLSGMPGYSKTLTDNQKWQVSLLLHEAHQLPAPTTTVLKPEPAATGR